MEEEIDIFKNQLLEVIKKAKENQNLSDTEFKHLQDTTIIENIIASLYQIGYTLKIVPFETPVDRFYSKSNMKNIAESIKQIEEGKIVVKTMEELEAMENE